MSKTQEQEPFFIVFANLDLDPTGRTQWKDEQWRKHIATEIKKAKTKYPHYKNRLNFPLLHPMLIVKNYQTLRDLLGQLTFDPTSERHISFSQHITEILKHVTPMLKWNKGKFSLCAVSKEFSLINSIAFEIAQFLTTEYKEGMFAKCGLEECNKIILTTNGQKYCSPAHRRKSYDQKRKIDSKKAEKIKRDWRLNKAYHRHLKASPSLIKKYPDFKTYKEKHA